MQDSTYEIYVCVVKVFLHEWNLHPMLIRFMKMEQSVVHMKMWSGVILFSIHGEKTYIWWH